MRRNPSWEQSPKGSLRLDRGRGALGRDDRDPRDASSPTARDSERSAARVGLPAAPLDGRRLLRLARDGSRNALETLAKREPGEIAAALQELTPRRRVEVLELSDRVAEIVPLLPETEFTATLVDAGVEEYGWLVEFATPEQRVAAVDLDCWRDFRLSPSRLLAWIDAMIAAGPPTLAAALDELDPELWVLALRSMGRFQASGAGEEDDALTRDGSIAWEAHTAEDEERIRAILGAALQLAPHHYGWLVNAALYESEAEAAESAAAWHQHRLADLGFPSREEAMRAYRPLSVDATPDPAEDDWIPRPRQEPVSQVPVPAPFAGRPLGRALAALSADRRDEVVRDVLGVANSLAVADKLPLAERDTVEQCVARAVRGIDLALEETSRRRHLPLSAVLDAVPALDLFRIGVGLDPALRPERTVADLVREEENPDWDWNEVREMIAEADRTLGPDARPR